MATKPAYKYPKVRSAKGLKNKCIRLFLLHPGGFDDDIQITITLPVFDLDKEYPFEYEALSYAWGSEEDPVAIIVNRNFKLHVTRNLESALRHLRYQHVPRILWIDAICINQKDVNERSHQVSFMGDVYRRARQVVIWLGLEENDSTYAMEYMEKLSSKIDVDWIKQKLTYIGPDDLDEPFDFHQSLKREGEALTQLLSRPWFERLWIRQEVFLSRSAVVRCGAKEIPWVQLKNAAVHLEQRNILFEKNNSGGRRDLDFRRRLRTAQDIGLANKRDIISVLERARSTKCKDPRDRVYGILNLVHRNLDIVPDYSMSAADVYSNLVERYIAVYGSLWPLPFAGLYAEENGPADLEVGILPSWVPNWNKPNSPGIRHAYWGQYNAGASLLSQCTTAEGNVLRVSGLLLSSIAQFSHSTEKPDHCTSYESLIQISRPIGKKYEDAYGGYKGLTEAYCRILHRDPFSDTLYPSLETQVRLSFQQARQVVVEAIEDSSDMQTDGDMPRLRRRFINTTDIESGRVCGAENGQIAFVPHASKIGDLLCVLPGFFDVAVLRPAADRPGSYYYVVGNAYVDGVMNGETLLGPLPDGWAVRIKHNKENGDWESVYLNTVTQEIQYYDPRLDKFGMADEGRQVSSWEDNDELLMRVTAKMLRDQGVELEDFNLI